MLIGDTAGPDEARQAIRGRLIKFFNTVAATHAVPNSRVPLLCCWWRLDALDSPSGSDVLGVAPENVAPIDDSSVCAQMPSVCSAYTSNDTIVLQAFDKSSGESKPHRRACASMLLKVADAAKYFENQAAINRSYTKRAASGSQSKRWSTATSQYHTGGELGFRDKLLEALDSGSP
jgi:hypothetical protein